MPSFRDVIVAPTAAMGWRPEPHELKTGPIWPDFAAQVDARHCRGLHPTPYDTAPDPPAGPLPAIAEAAWCGPWCFHFGHAIVDFGMRILASARSWPGLPLLFTPDPRGDSPPGFFWAILDAWGVGRDRVVLVREPVTVRTLHVLPQAERMHGPPPDPAYLDLLDAAVAGPADPDLAGRTVLLSRARVTPRSLEGRIAGEAFIDSVLAAAGVVVAHPEALPVAAQIRLYRSAGRLLFSEGSALHGLQLVGRVAASVDVLVRRPGERMAEAAVSARSPDAAWLDATAGQVEGMRRDGLPDAGTGITALDPDRLLPMLGERLGIDLAPHWDARAFREAARLDLRRWIAHRATLRHRHHDPEGDAATVARTAAGVALLAEPQGLVQGWTDAVEAARRREKAVAGDAAEGLASLLGIDPGQFSRPKPGAAALVGSCEVVDVLGPLGPGAGPHGADPALRARIRAAWARKAWLERARALNEAFLAHVPHRHIPAPLSGGEAALLGSLPLGQYQVSLLLDGDRPLLLVALGPVPVGLYHPADSLFLVLSAHAPDPRAALRTLLEHLLSRPGLWLDWMRRATGAGLRRALVIADQHPGHFIRQSLAWLDREEAAIRAFVRDGGLLVAAPDLCALDPFAVLPSLAQLDRLTLPGDRLTDALLAGGYDAHRVYRANFYPDAAWLRRRLAPLIAAAPPPPPGRRYCAMISLDADGRRTANEPEALRSLLRTLAEACARDGSALDLVWDAWAAPARPWEADTVAGRAEPLVAAILDGLDAPIGEQRRVFGLSPLEKLPEILRCDLVVSAQGVITQLSSWLLRRPTITWARNGARRVELDEATAHEIDPRALADAPGEDRGNRVLLAPWGVEDALRRAAGARLDIRPTHPPPEGR
ncbi:glycosyltransferase family 61 protein [Roseomonas populi]|uniref:Glycosyltransferase family 61 protein n=1 Tax=Roseomonas populi TaxID=3121582 RepID=A0ABT1X022_9PROT|nr:glycosyltransferase family 61 protein [Roseomonas pecuniae]MCR0981445.1 glycosyltransferase family 61 protein [Roseomonas pecuniae]